MILFVAALAGAVAAKSPASAPSPENKPPPPGRLPGFSWATVPVFFHAASPTPYNSTQLATLARYPLVTLEKYYGPFPLKPRHGEEDNIAAVAKSLGQWRCHRAVIVLGCD